PKFRRDLPEEPVATVNSAFERKSSIALNLEKNTASLSAAETLAEEKDDEVLELGQELDLSPQSSKAADASEDTSRVVPDLAVEEAVEEKSADASVLVEKFGQYDPQLDLSSYQFPHLGLLRDYGSGKIVVNNAELEANKDRIVDTLANYNIEIEKIKATIGPTVTLYEIVPKPGVRISKIKNLEDDIALSLAALGIRIIAPMPGKGTIGIEVPNSQPEMVSMRTVIATERFQHTDMDLPIAFGKTITNEVFIADLAKMPHLLVAGATGQGKS